ncbi:MAG: class A beta-lactamase-related serine hydrolase [Candidatus Aenigmarchaeota archaeon]|nr:class A beta-lactamase-related serine hydrolase [Candidatus Aenigmarchaeota archaeon]
MQHGGVAAPAGTRPTRVSRTVALLVATNIVLAAALVYVLMQNAQIQAAHKSNFDLLSANIAWMDLDDFLQKQKTMTVSYLDLKQSMLGYMDSQKLSGRYSVYFEDLTTGAWTGIDERETFIPASLLKMPTVIATLKKVELGSLSLDTAIVLTDDMIDYNFGNLSDKGPGYAITVKDLLKFAVRDSDNTALWALDSLLTPDEYIAARAAVGMPYVSQADDLKVSPKSYSNILRSLYMSTYLRRTFSQLALSMMAETDYNNEMPAGVPVGTTVAHKVGYNMYGGYYHDCGIVYAPDKPYILCVMSRNSTLEEADIAIRKISFMTYNYVMTGHAE